jgi:hypothetical protein
MIFPSSGVHIQILDLYALKMTKKTIILLSLIFVLSARGASRAEDIFGIGIHFGGHQDVGNIHTQRPNILVDTQSNWLMGMSMKANIFCAFLRTGIDGTFLLNKGSVLEDSDQIQNLKIQYMSLPMFMGLRFPLRDLGECYIGGGFAYMFSYGSVKVRNQPVYDLNASTMGYGFLCGIELSFPYYFHIYLEWQYIDARSSALFSTQTDPNLKDFYIDFSGHRFFFGVIYYAI